VRICHFEDGAVSRLGPLAQTRPAFDLRCGALTLAERQARHFGAEEAGAVVRQELVEACRQAHPRLVANDPTWLAGGPLVLVNARWLPPAGPGAVPATAEVGVAGGQIAYVVVPAEQARGLAPANLPWHLSAWEQAWPKVQAGGAMIDWPWHPVEHNAEALEADYPHWAERHAPGRFDGVSVLGPPERFRAAPGAAVEPAVVIDTRKGPVLLDEGAAVGAFSRIEGPCYVGLGTQFHAARVSGSSFGPQCRIGGEVESSVVQGYSNKAHDGFLGHSYVGEWVNLGAGTITSDLRNDYGPVSVVVGGQKVETGLLKVGTFFGDHAKASIGCLFNTGSLIGPFALLVTAGTLLPRSLPAFCEVRNGRPGERTDLRVMFATAAAMMGRRGRAWTEAQAELYFDLYERTAGERRQLLRDSEQRRLRRVV
jgi:UDP-N-acetylglucosamine diphosphorylase/glucosamine-1-phosphate N-acetyltransferase